MSGFNDTELFGGAIKADLPTGYLDVSDIRQVPDNQEIYLDRSGSTNIIFDITERVETTADDQAALVYHLEDIVESVEEMKIWATHPAVVPSLPPTTQILTTLATSTSPGNQVPAADFTAILLTLIRLEAQKTDLLVVVNIPHIPGCYVPGEVVLEHGKQGKLIEGAIEMRDRVLASLKIEDWGLFVSE
ncbi:MAG: hypothetical protein M1829_004816 [Trizodia sp. TS-e1964]|nr:MAG: hypothetical protein M1829_004816 [Trizodia sp. TS-e1964]